MTLGATGAWWSASELGARRPIFAALVPLVAMTGDPFAAVSVSLSRVVGVFAGVGIGIGATHLDLPTTWRVALALLAGTLVATGFSVGGRPNLEVPIAALFLIGFASAGATELGVQRIWETAIGGVIGIAVTALLWPPDPVRQLERDLDRLRNELIDDLAAIADDLATGSGATSGRLEDVRAHSLDAVRDVFELDAAKRALRWNPLRRHDEHEVELLGGRINLAARVYRHARSIARDVADEPMLDRGLASAVRDVADAADRLLRGEDASAPLRRARSALHGGTAVGAQLRQLHADLMRQEP